MRILESDVDGIKNALQKSWQAGHRWVVYEDGGNVTAQSITSVPTAAAANVYCENRYTDAHLFKFKAITSVLKSIFEAEGRLVVAPPNTRRLEMEIKRLSILPASWDDDLIKSLQRGEIYPVILQRQVDPQVEIGSYKILQQYEGPETVSGGTEQVPTEIASYRHFQSAADHFHKIYEKHAAHSYQKPSVFFVGEFREHKLIMGSGGFPEKNTGVLLSMGRALYELDQPETPYNLILVNDPKLPTIINEPVLAQYNSQTNRINLMDGRLKSITTKLAPYLDIEHFGFKCAITVEQPLTQTQRQVQDNHVVTESFRNRPL